MPTATEERKGAGGISFYKQGAAPVIPLYLFTFFPKNLELSAFSTLPRPGQNSRERYLKRL